MDSIAVEETKSPLTLKQFEKDMKKTVFSAIITALIGCLLSVLLSSVAFYYNSNSKFNELFNTQKSHTKNIEDLTKTLQNLVTTTAVESTKPQSQAIEIQEIKKRMDRYEEKQDKIYEILVQINQRNK